MSIRLSIGCYQALVIASSRTGLSYTTIGNKAMRKFNRQEADIVTTFNDKKYGYKLTKKPVQIRFKPSLIKGKSPQLIRDILDWYLDTTPVKTKRTPLHITQGDIDLLYNISNGAQLAEQIINNT